MIQQALPDATELDRAVESVLARPEFAERELPGPLQWLADAFAALQEALWGMISEWDALRHAAPLIGWLVLGAALLFLGVMLWFLGARALRLWRARDRGGVRGDSTEGPAPPETMQPATWEARAREELAAGRLREAAMALYRAMLLRLDRIDALTFDPSKTPGDYRRETAGETAPGRALHHFLTRFEPIAFGGRAVSPEAFADLESAAREAGVHV